MKGAESRSVPSPVSTILGSRIISQSQDYWKTCKQRNNKGSTKSVARWGLKDSLKFSQKNPLLHKTRASRKQPTEPVPCWEKAEVAITVLLHHLVHTTAPERMWWWIPFWPTESSKGVLACHTLVTGGRGTRIQLPLPPKPMLYLPLRTVLIKGVSKKMPAKSPPMQLPKDFS